MAEPIDPRRVAWLARRAGFGAHASELPEEPVDGDDAIDALMAAPATTPADPWDGLDLDPQDGGRAEAVRAWVLRLLDSPTPFLDRRTLMLHGWIVNGVDKVPPPLMVDQIRLFMEIGGESYPELLRRVTTDASMLVYLDGRTSTGTEPNENYARELLELFALGVGTSPDGSDQPYTEDDVVAAARALTGWGRTTRHHRGHVPPPAPRSHAADPARRLRCRRRRLRDRRGDRPSRAPVVRRPSHRLRVHRRSVRSVADRGGSPTSWTPTTRPVDGSTR